MLCSNQDVLFEMGKKFIEDGDSDSLIRLALSGREPMKAMKTVFACVTTFKIGYNCFAIGWGNSRCSEFKFKTKEPPMKFLLYQIGNYVKELHIDYKFIEPYQPILDKIIEKKQLVTFSTKWGYQFLSNFIETLPIFASSLKNITIPNYKMTSTFRDTFNLDTLTVINYTARNILLFCCKTKSLEISYGSAHILACYRSIPKDVSPYLSSIKHLIINGGSASTGISSLSVDDLCKLMKYFGSLESLEHSVAVYSEHKLQTVNNIVNCFIKFANNAIKVPLIATYSFTVQLGQSAIIDGFKQVNSTFKCDETNPRFYCFRKLIQSAATQSTIFEVRFYKK